MSVYDTTEAIFAQVSRDLDVLNEMDNAWLGIMNGLNIHAIVRNEIKHGNVYPTTRVHQIPGRVELIRQRVLYAHENVADLSRLLNEIHHERKR